MGLLIEPTHMEDEDEEQESEKEEWMTCARHLEPMSRATLKCVL